LCPALAWSPDRRVNESIAYNAQYAGLFLRRYITYYARRKRYAATQGAAVLHREVADALRITAA
jgi:hypothetical protein